MMNMVRLECQVTSAVVHVCRLIGGIEPAVLLELHHVLYMALMATPSQGSHWKGPFCKL
jgi:hypothetical protein